jgi:5-methylcytosine-specific restriction endonuclease McrA
MVSQSVRRLVADRAGKSCEYCKSQENYAPQPFSVEHIYPQSLGGKSLLDNLALSCQGCNNAKYTKTEARDPVTGQLVPLFHPRHDRWSDRLKLFDK